jgi:hypothetical protein
MPFPNPANYFLPTPEQFETEIVELDLEELKLLNFDLAKYLNSDLDSDPNERDIDDPIEFESACLSTEADTWIERLKVGDLISLIRWIGERLAYLHRMETVIIPQEEVVTQLLDNLHKQSN